MMGLLESDLSLLFVTLFCGLSATQSQHVFQTQLLNYTHTQVKTT